MGDSLVLIGKIKSMDHKAELFDLIIESDCLVRVMTLKEETSIRFDNYSHTAEDNIREYARLREMDVREL